MPIAKHKTRRRQLREGRTLARRVQRGDRRAFALLYASYEGGLFRFCERLTGSSGEAAALVEATFARAFAMAPGGGPDTVDVGAHLYATARSLSYGRNGNGDGDPAANGNGHVNGTGHANGYANGHANGNGNGQLNGHASGNGHGAEPVRRAAGEHAREVVAANARLAPRQRMALALRDLEGRTDDEIALALGSEAPVVPALVARARLRLRAELALPAAVAGCRGHLADLSAYADRTLPVEHRVPVETHLEQCPDCRAALFALQEAAQRYRAVPLPEPPGELSSRMAAAIHAAGLALPGVHDGSGEVVAPQPEPDAPVMPAPLLPAGPDYPATPVAGIAPAGEVGATNPSVPEIARAPAIAVIPAIGVAAAEIAPAVDGTPAVEATPVVEAIPVAEIAPVVEAMPVTDVALVAEPAPADEAAVGIEAVAGVATIPAITHGGRQGVAAIAMAALLVLGLIVTFLARDTGSGHTPARSPSAHAAKLPAAPRRLPPAGATTAPAASHRGGGATRPAPARLRHARSGSLPPSHRAKPVTGSGTRRVIARGGASSRPGGPATSNA